MNIIEVCNIWKCQCDVKLRHDEQLCPMCNGQGARFLNASFKQKYLTIMWCKLCIGEGKIDWIRAINQQFPTSPDGYTLPINTRDIKMKCIGPEHCKKKLKRLWMNEKSFTDPHWPYKGYKHVK